MGIVMNAVDKPIGYWLKHLHNLIEAQFDVALADLGVGRRHWQLMNLLSHGAHTPAQLEQALAPFWQDAALRLDALLDGPEGLVTRGWVRYGTAGGALGLTEQGRTAHATVAARIREARGQLLRGLTPQQYTETVRILSVMAGNIEDAIAEQNRTEPHVVSGSHATPDVRTGSAAPGDPRVG
jgi:hypothetical protein